MNVTLYSAVLAIPDDYRQFCQMLVEFLQYITNNQFLDDVRVMNIVSNIQDPFTQWTRNEPENRSGMLDQAIDISAISKLCLNKTICPSPISML